MECHFHIQDPLNPETVYLHEAIINELMEDKTESWKGMYAFASGIAIRNMFVDEGVVTSFMKKGKVDVIVGIDAVTNVLALENLSLIEKENTNFTAKVFVSANIPLFHPKFSIFNRRDGISVLIVGSGNFTTGGFKNNLEAFTIVKGNQDEIYGLSAWDSFLENHKNEVLYIDEQVLELARENVNVKINKKKQVETFRKLESEIDQENDVLIAQVPKAGNRWRQIHYNKDVVDRFFKMKPNSPQRAHLYEVLLSGEEKDYPEIRPLIYSSSNANYKIEVSSRLNETYPSSDCPIIVLKKIGTRVFRYTLVMPSDKYYKNLLDATNSYPTLGKGKNRILIDYSELKKIWQSCPL